MGARRLFVKVNTDATYRAKFIKDPIRMLRSNGITLSPRDQKELLEVMDDFKRILPNLGELPKGYDVLISAIAKGHRGRGKFKMLLV